MVGLIVALCVVILLCIVSWVATFMMWKNGKLRGFEKEIGGVINRKRRVRSASMDDGEDLVPLSSTDIDNVTRPSQGYVFQAGDMSSDEEEEEEEEG